MCSSELVLATTASKSFGLFIKSDCRFCFSCSLLCSANVVQFGLGGCEEQMRVVCIVNSAILIVDVLFTVNNHGA